MKSGIGRIIVRTGQGYRRRKLTITDVVSLARFTIPLVLTAVSTGLKLTKGWGVIRARSGTALAVVFVLFSGEISSARERGDWEEGQGLEI
jgi:hypothetical protein